MALTSLAGGKKKGNATEVSGRCLVIAGFSDNYEVPFLTILFNTECWRLPLSRENASDA